MAGRSDKVTPMMAQFLEIREEHPDALLFFRMGDFYELFFEDAVKASKALDIALTKRGKHLGEDIAMCGVPVHAADGYLLTLIRKGFKVAVCEQLESPSEAKKRGAKSVVKRGVIRLITPGTLTEDSLLDARRSNHLAAFHVIREEAALAWTDISTGEITVIECAPSNLASLLARLAPSEVLIADDTDPTTWDIVSEMGATATELARSSFDSNSAELRLKNLYGVSSLDGFGSYSRVEVSALGAIIDYLSITQKNQLPRLKTPKRELLDNAVQIDAATRANLELVTSLNGGTEATLLSAIDQTQTSGGARLLKSHVANPLRHLETLEQRLDKVQALFDNTPLADQLTETLRKTPDIARALTRITLDRGGPRDLNAIKAGLTSAKTLAEHLENQAEFHGQLNALTNFDALTALIDRAIIEHPPLLARDGGFIAPGYDADLDALIKMRDDGKSVIAARQQTYIEQTGVQSLKVKHNNVLGYFIETPATHADRMLAEPLSELFIHRQTTANAVRFTTVELSGLETKIINAGAEALQIEKSIFENLCQQVLDETHRIQETAAAIDLIDVAQSHASIARDFSWTRPALSNSKVFQIEKGRHPVVEAALRKESRSFVANNCYLTENDEPLLWLITGPNMAGKSTYLRANAIIALLAQIGAFVPAARAEIGLVSQIFSRVGASDDLARGRSTFMVEMVETAAILNQANDKALVILDEIGRGTSTYDGLSIAWATVEYLRSINKCRALFATHYHELTRLEDQVDGLRNASVQVEEKNGEIIFLHEVQKGQSGRSYGVEVAKLAGLPAPVIARAQQLLTTLESDPDTKTNALNDLPLFSAEQTSERTGPSPIDEAVDAIDPDSLTPRDALAALYRLKELAKNQG